MSQYTILDEAPVKDRERQPPWNPGALFFIMWGLYVVVSLLAPLVGVCFAINWARLGQPQKRLPFLAASAAAFLLPFLLVSLTGCLRFPGEKRSAHHQRRRDFLAGHVGAVWPAPALRSASAARRQSGGHSAGAWRLRAVALLCLWLVVRNRG
jgi:hypothetical protein